MRPHCGGAADGVGMGKSTVAVVAAGFVVRAEGYLEGMVRIPRAPSDHGMVRIPRPPSDHGMVRPSVPPAGNAGRWIGLWFLQLLFQAESRVIQAMLVIQWWIKLTSTGPGLQRHDCVWLCTVCYSNIISISRHNVCVQTFSSIKISEYLNIILILKYFLSQ